MRDHRARRWTTILAGVVATGLIVGCSWGNSGHESEPRDNPPESVPSAAAPSPQAPAPELASTGTVLLTFRGTSGTDRVACSSITSEVKITAYSGRIVWTAQAVDRQPSGWPIGGNRLSDVTFDPPTGVLEEGGSTVMRIGGSFSGGGAFFVAVSAPNSAGHGYQTIQFNCS